MCPTGGALSGYAVPIGSVEKERKQYYTGEGFYKPLVVSLLAGLPVKSRELLWVREDIANDGSLAKTLLLLQSAPPTGVKIPLMACSMLVSQGSKKSVANTVNYLDTITTNYVKELARGGMALRGYQLLPPLKDFEPIPLPDVALYQHTVPVVEAVREGIL